MQACGISGSAEELLGGILSYSDEVITDTVLAWYMEYVDKLRALHGDRWRVVLRRRAADIDRGVPPIEPQEN